MTFGEGSKSQGSGVQVGVGSREGLRHRFLGSEKEKGDGGYGHSKPRGPGDSSGDLAPLLPQAFLPLPILSPSAANVSVPEHNSDHTCFKLFSDFPLHLNRLKPQNSVHGPVVAPKLSSFHSIPSLPSDGSLDRPQLLHTPGPLHMLFLPSQSQPSSRQLCPAFRSWLPCPFLCETSP